MIVAKQHAQEEMRIFGGGYVIMSAMVIRFLEITGIIWGFMGLMGTWLNKESYCQVYNYYQMARVVAWGFMYYTDLPVLWDCEMYVLNIEGAIKKHGWNPTMFKIATEGRCIQERQLCMLFSTIALFFFIYLTWINMQYQKLLNDAPRYLFHLPKDTPDGAFYTQSLGEKEHLLKGQPVGSPVSAPTPPLI